MFKQGFAPIAIIIIAIVLLAAGGIYLWQSAPGGPVAVPQPPTDPTANWKTYRNEKYGFEFKYPAEWIICPPAITPATGATMVVCVKDRVDIKLSNDVSVSTYFFVNLPGPDESGLNYNILKARLIESAVKEPFYGDVPNPASTMEEKVTAYYVPYITTEGCSYYCQIDYYLFKRELLVLKGEYYYMLNNKGIPTNILSTFKFIQ